MTMEETMLYVNEKLKEGYSIAKVERELNYGKDTLRKKLNRAGFQYDKALKKFIFDANTVVTHAENKIIDNHITQNITHNVTHSNVSKTNTTEDKFNTTQDITQTITHVKNQPITQDHNTNITHDNDRALTDEDFHILFEIIDKYKSKENNKSKNIVIPRDDSELTTRSFRSYKSIFDSFSKYCKDNSLNQKDAIANALISFISK